MPNKLQYNWEEIQEYYDKNHSLRDCQNKFGFGTTASSKAIKAGRLVLRSHREACDLRRKNQPPEPTGNVCSPTTWKGELGCCKLEQRALEKNVIISRPSVECAYDRILDIEGRLHRVQVKYSSEVVNGVLLVRVAKTCRKRSTKISYGEEIDAIVVYCPVNDKLYWLPNELFVGHKCVSLRLKDVLHCDGRNAADYEW